MIIFETIFLILIIIIVSILFFWLVILKIAARFINTPCPAGVSFIVSNPLRRKYMKPVLGRVGIQPGERILELGPGPGIFTINAAKQLEPGGTLIAVDIQREMINKLKEKLQENKIDNVETIIAGAYDLPIPDNSIDRAFLVTVLPEIPDKVKALREIYRVLKPGGIFSDTEEFIDPDYPFAGTVIKWAQEAGFKLDKRYGNFWLYTLNFKRGIGN